ncbi:hypothetical protein pb186bvf_017422 [Paramecium bursaria]
MNNKTIRQKQQDHLKLLHQLILPCLCHIQQHKLKRIIFKQRSQLVTLQYLIWDIILIPHFSIILNLHDDQKQVQINHSFENIKIQIKYIYLSNYAQMCPNHFLVFESKYKKSKILQLNRNQAF